ncbi:hypothetical protein [Paracidovorax avenae]|uniref:hypothetical protein n=1 Tax=Paracidovorax avenae TaxID=80867 RepID=UPI0006B339B8|nr:hypothetical protein [Paracidovorax avenae]
MFGINHLRRAIGGGSSRPESPSRTPSPPARASSPQAAHAQGMPPARQAAPAAPAGHAAAAPRVDIRAPNVSRSPLLPWEVASRLYDRDVLTAARLEVQDRLMAEGSPHGEAVALSRETTQDALHRAMAQQADARNLPREEVSRQLEGNPELRAEFTRLFQKMEGLHAGRLSYRRSELLHIASVNLAARQRRAPQGEARRPPDAGRRDAASRRTRPAQAAPQAAPGRSTGSTAARPTLARSHPLQGPRFNPAFAPVRPQGALAPADGPAPGAATGRRVRFAEYALREGIAEPTDGTRGRPARLPPEERDTSLSAIHQQIRVNSFHAARGELQDVDDGAELSAPAQESVVVSAEDRETIESHWERLRPPRGR